MIYFEYYCWKMIYNMESFFLFLTHSAYHLSYTGITLTPISFVAQKYTLSPMKYRHGDGWRRLISLPTAVCICAVIT